MEQRLLDHVDPPGLVGLASDLIRVPSFKTEETRLAQWLAEYSPHAAMRWISKRSSRAAFRRSPH
jgi:hypothetical protein